MKRTKLNLKCRECGSTTVVHTKQPMQCKNCKNTKWYCFNCQAYFEPTEICLRCRWFICPNCGSCGCDYVRGPIRRIARIRGRTLKKIVGRRVTITETDEVPLQPLYY